MNEKLKNLNKKQFEKCLITLEMLTFATPKKYTDWLSIWIKLLKCRLSSLFRIILIVFVVHGFFAPLSFQR